MKCYKAEVVVFDEIECDTPQDTMDYIADVISVALRDHGFHPDTVNVDPI